MGKTFEYLKSNVRYYRKLKEMSQQDLAEKSDISTSFIQEIEIGRKQPSLNTLDKIADALEIDSFKLLMNPDKNDFYIIKDFSNVLKEKIINEVNNLADKY